MTPPERKRVVVWGTGVVGSMVVAEIAPSAGHPLFELVGVGVSNPAKVGKDAAEVCGLAAPTGVVCTDSVEELIALRPDALVHYGPTAQYADDNIRVIGAFLRAGIDVCSTAMTPWVWPGMKQNPAAWIDPITEACEVGGSSCFTTGIDPGFANDLFPLTLMGLCGRVDSVRASELLDYTDYEGDYPPHDVLRLPRCAPPPHNVAGTPGTRTRWASAAHPTSPRCSRSPTCSSWRGARRCR